MSYSYGLNLTKAERISKNCRDMVELKQGTVPYDRELGVNARWLHKENQRYTGQMLTEITDMLNARETRARSKVSFVDGSIQVEVTPND